MQNSMAKFCSFPGRALLFHNNSPVTLHCSPATAIILNEIAALDKFFCYFLTAGEVLPQWLISAMKCLIHCKLCVVISR